jgi:putative ubiquitin-RnfH superfamily antitoxin RatB of RatAB toxin-antitoxin module
MTENASARFMIEVVYATPARQKLIELSPDKKITAREAALASGLDSYFPDINLQQAPLGVFGKVVQDDHVLEAGDRVEIYRPLINEPSEARRAAAARGDTLGGGPPKAD